MLRLWCNIHCVLVETLNKNTSQSTVSQETLINSISLKIPSQNTAQGRALHHYLCVVCVCFAIYTFTGFSEWIAVLGVLVLLVLAYKEKWKHTCCQSTHIQRHRPHLWIYSLWLDFIFGVCVCACTHMCMCVGV